PEDEGAVPAPGQPAVRRAAGQVVERGLPALLRRGWLRSGHEDRHRGLPGDHGPAPPVVVRGARAPFGRKGNSMRSLSRRALLGSAGMAAAAAVLAACGASAPTPAPTAAPAKPAEAPKP